LNTINTISANGNYSLMSAIITHNDDTMQSKNLSNLFIENTLINDKNYNNLYNKELDNNTLNFDIYNYPVSSLLNYGLNYKAQNIISLDASPIKPVNMFDLPGERRDVLVSSFFGTNIVQSGSQDNRETAVNTFSQSVAYSMNDNGRIGVEFGYTEYNTVNQVYVKKTANGSQQPESIADNNEIGGLVEVLNRTEGSGSLIKVPQSIDRQNQAFWGSAFYELNLLRLSNLTMIGRLGIGGTDAGPLGYSRLFLKYDVLKIFSLTVGGDGRAFYIKVPTTGESENEVISSFSLIYGVQFKF
ncbi:MAG: hypothetical protein QG635_1639, partial [Bacteroidota bacterium]|nr:hypothetical protein [Bacteroidota bacterium]